MSENRPEFIHLVSDGVSFVLHCHDEGLPNVLHWGAEIGLPTYDELLAIAVAGIPPRVPNTPDRPVPVSLLPEGWAGWMGRPGLSGHRDGAAWSPKFTIHRVRSSGTTADGDGRVLTVGRGTVRIDAVDEATHLRLLLEVEMTEAGLIRARASVTNTGTNEYTLDDIAIALPVPTRAREILDFAGRWGKERTPQRRELVIGAHERDNRRGRTGADAATVLTVGTPGFGFADGEVWGVHVGWSGNHRHYAERLLDGTAVIGGGPLLLAGEKILGPDASLTTPWIYAAYGIGLDAQAARFHRYLRARPHHPASPRPVTLNVWEAVYFEHDLDRLTALAVQAAAIGVERYVLDDGWFRHRRDDTAGLGDWFVDETIWPDGLTPIIDRVRGLGMQFGLWFEPEMISPDSDLARAHPDWIMRADGGRLPVPFRNQQVLNLTVPEAYAYVLGRMTAIIGEYDIDYVKWDHNRDLIEAGTPGLGARVHDQTLATYRLMATLKQSFPRLEIETCASGGGRVDLGVLEHTDRVWVSDCIDPLDRQQMNRWTMQLLPPELLGSHIASGTSHTTLRSHRLRFRAGTALLGHLGIEWDLTTASPAELDELRQWIDLYKDSRALLHTGALIRVDEVDDTSQLYGVVSHDKCHAVFFLATLSRSETSPRGRIRFRGLSPERTYRIAPITLSADTAGVPSVPWSARDLRLTGRVLETVGVQAPALPPEEVFLFRLDDTGAADADPR